jgi:hypothetical protein
MRFSEVMAVEYGAAPDAIASLARPAVRVSGQR